MKSFNLVVVDTGDQAHICYTPYNTLRVGDQVVIESGTGTVTDLAYTYTEDEVFKFFKRNMPILPVKAVIREIDFSEVEM